MEEQKPKTQQSDFSKIMQQQWKEEQLLAEIEELKDEIKAKERQIAVLENTIKEREALISKMKEHFTTTNKELLTLKQNLEIEVKEKDKQIQKLKKEVNILRVALEEEQNKSLWQVIFRKKKK